MLTSVFNMRLNTYGIVASWVFGIASIVGTVLCSVFLSLDAINNISSDSMRVGIKVGLYFCLALLVINTVASGMLAVGTLKKHHMYIVPWLMNNGLIMVCLTLLYIVTWVSIFKLEVDWDDRLLILSIYTVVLVVGWYMFFGICSLFKQVQAHREANKSVHWERA